MKHTDNHTATHRFLNSSKSFSLVILLILLSLPVLSQPAGAGGQPPELHLQRMADRLELSQQQRTEIQAIMSSGKLAGKPTADAMQANRETLEQLINTTSPDQAQIQSLAETQGDLLTESLLQKAAVKQQVYTVLTAEQRIKMLAYKDARRDMRASRKLQRSQQKFPRQKR